MRAAIHSPTRCKSRPNEPSIKTFTPTRSSPNARRNPQPNEMQIAEILSDLTSLRACNHDEALALVHTNTTLHVPEPPNPSPAKGRKRSGTSKSEIRDPYSSRPASTTLGSAGKSSGTKAEGGAEEDPDLRRAIDLVELHCSVKVKRLQGADLGLQRARGDVDEVLRKLRGGEGDVVQRR